jgi:hypothetical protein
VKTLKKLIPGQPGTKSLFKEYGDKFFPNIGNKENRNLGCLIFMFGKTKRKIDDK